MAAGLALLSLAGTALGLVGCAAVGTTTLVLYNGQHPQTTQTLVRAFEAATGVQVAVRSNDEDVLAQQLVQEGSGSPADLIYTENSPALEFLQRRHLLARGEASTLALVPRRYRSPQGEWVGVSARVSVLVYNTHLLRPVQLPRSVMQLADPRWRGLLGIAPGETDFQPIVTAVDRAHGRSATIAWLRGLKANAGPRVYPDNETLTAMVNSGQAAIGLINAYYWYRLRAEDGASGMHCALAFLAPGNPGYVVDVSGAAVLRSSRHQAVAQRFLNFLVSRRGQEILA
ncbi:MAG: extracellular solute-binding protein, partial [Candidatus Dormibacteria bacterium]